MKWYCPQCGRENHDNFCQYCGERPTDIPHSKNKRRMSVGGVIATSVWIIGIIGSYKETIAKTEPLLAVLTFVAGAVLFYTCGAFGPRILRTLRHSRKSFAKPNIVPHSINHNFKNSPTSNHSQNPDNQKFDSMNGHEFEYFCADLLNKNNFKNVEVTKGSGDQGIDILATKDGIKYGIQCKCYASDIGNKAVQEAFSGKTFYECHVAAVLTNRHFTQSAKELAQKNGVLLWDRNMLLALMKTNIQNNEASTDYSQENITLQRIMPKINEWHIDTLYITTSSRCPQCQKYNQKIYSLYGWDKHYPILPNELKINNCPYCKTCIGLSIYFNTIN